MTRLTNLTTNVYGCSRCGQNHEQVNFYYLIRPISADNGSRDWTHWGTCPTHGEPILLRVEGA